MRGARHFFSREKQVFLVGFSLTIPRFPRKSKNRLNTSLGTIMQAGITCMKIPCYMRDSTCSWFSVKKAKLF